MLEMHKLKKTIANMNPDELSRFLVNPDPCQYCIRKYEDDCGIMKIKDASDGILYCQRWISEFLISDEHWINKLKTKQLKLSEVY